MAPWEKIVVDLRGALAPSGLDLVGATTAGAYHASLEGDARARLALPGEPAPDRLVVCVGNTKALWPALVDAARRDERLGVSAHPVDDHAGAVLERAAAEVAARHAVALWAVAAREEGPPKLALARLGALSGIGHVAPCQLLVHATHGPWIGLRGAVVADVGGPERAVAAPSPCERCPSSPCVGARDAAVRASGGPDAVTRESIARDHALWLRIRLVCPVGAASRYDDAQAEYHYTKRRSLLPFRGGGSSD